MSPGGRGQAEEDPPGRVQAARDPTRVPRIPLDDLRDMQTLHRATEGKRFIEKRFTSIFFCPFSL